MGLKDDHDDWPMVPEFCSIPSEFHSLEFEGPFEKCMLCDRDLFDSYCQYYVERIFRGTEPIVEYAMCFDCQQSMCDEFSEESQQNMQTFFSRVDHDARIERLRERDDQDGIDPWIDECLITGKKRAECRGYQIIGVCQATELQLAVTPFMLSDEAVEQIMKVISKKTRDRLDDFTGEHFGMPPEFCERPDFFPILI